MPKHVDLSNDAVRRYILDTGTRETAVMARLRRETATMAGAGMQISPDQGQVLQFLVRLTGARQILEIGTYTGYSALCMASALPADGRLIACDLRTDWTEVADRYWQEAQVRDRIDLRIGPALETLAALRADGRDGTFDMAFIDADKTAYDTYYEACLKLLRVGGLLAIDNVIWKGAVADPTNTEDSTQALRALNAKIQADARVDMALMTIGDGMTVVRKR